MFFYHRFGLVLRGRKRPRAVDDPLYEMNYVYTKIFVYHKSFRIWNLWMRFSEYSDVTRSVDCELNINKLYMWSLNWFVCKFSIRTCCNSLLVDLNAFKTSQLLRGFLVDKIGLGHCGPFIWIVNVVWDLPMVTTKSFISRSKPIPVLFFYEFASADYANTAQTALLFQRNWYFQIPPMIQCKFQYTFRNWMRLFWEISYDKIYLFIFMNILKIFRRFVTVKYEIFYE